MYVKSMHPLPLSTLQAGCYIETLRDFISHLAKAVAHSPLVNLLSVLIPCNHYNKITLVHSPSLCYLVYNYSIEVRDRLVNMDYT